jgi:hypothetical protein
MKIEATRLVLDNNCAEDNAPLFRPSSPTL